MSGGRSYSDDTLRAAIAASRSWRGVLRALGLTATSAGSMRSVRRHADELGLDYSHFSGQRRWTDAQLADAVATSRTWTQVQERLGLTGGSATTALKGHAVRLGLDTSHVGTHATPVQPPSHPGADRRHLRRAGPMLAAAWYALRGHDVAWPLEPAAYDLLAWSSGTARRVQVKTTTVRSGTSWIVRIGQSGRRHAPYDPELVDDLFVVDGDLGCHLIPMAVVGGLTTITLGAYADYAVGRLGLEPE